MRLPNHLESSRAFDYVLTGIKHGSDSICVKAPKSFATAGEVAHPNSQKRSQG